MAFDQEAFNAFAARRAPRFLEESKAQHSGRTTNVYFSWRSEMADVGVSATLADFVVQYVAGLDWRPDSFLGVAEGSTLLGYHVQQLWNKSHQPYPFSMMRATPKQHGLPEERHFVSPPKGKTLILEDTTTTGRSIEKAIAAVNALPADEATLYGVLVLTDRDELTDGLTVAQQFEQQGIPYVAMSHALDILPKAYQEQQPGSAIARKVEEQYARQYGRHVLKLL